MDGLDLVCRALYDVTLRHELPAPGEVWSDSVYKVVSLNDSLVDVKDVDVQTQ